jgi:hypothetical protein
MMVHSPPSQYTPPFSTSYTTAAAAPSMTYSSDCSGCTTATSNCGAVVVTGLLPCMTESHVLQLLQPYGVIRSLNWTSSTTTSCHNSPYRPSGSGHYSEGAPRTGDAVSVYCEYVNNLAAIAVKNKLDGHMLLGKRLSVQFVVPAVVPTTTTIHERSNNSRKRPLPLSYSDCSTSSPGKGNAIDSSGCKDGDLYPSRLSVIRRKVVDTMAS